MTIKKLLSSLLLVLAVALAAIAPSLFAGCSPILDNAKNAASAQPLQPVDAAAQLRGVTASVKMLLSASPLASTPAAAAAMGWATSVSSFASQYAQGLASKDQLSGALTALCGTVSMIPLDAGTQAAISLYLEWAKVAVGVLPATGSLVEQEWGGAGAIHPTA